MSRLVHEGNTKVYLALAVANKSAPTLAEIAAATNLTPFITKDGVTTPSNQNMVDAAGIDTVFDAQYVGSWGGPVSLTMFRDDDDETDSWELITYGLEGWIIVSRFGVPTTGSTVEVYPVQAHKPVMQQTATNEMQKFTAMFAVTDAPDDSATVAAS